MNEMSNCERHRHRRAATKTGKARVICNCSQVYWVSPDEALTAPCPLCGLIYADGVTYPGQYEG